MGVIRLPEYLPPPPRRQSIPVPGMLHSAFLHLPFLGPPAFGCLGHGELARYCHGIATVLLRCCSGVAPVLRWCCDGVAMVLRWCCSLGYPLYIPCTSLLLRSGLRQPFGVSTEPRLGFDSILLAAIQRESHFPMNLLPTSVRHPRRPMHRV